MSDPSRCPRCGGALLRAACSHCLLLAGLGPDEQSAPAPDDTLGVEEMGRRLPQFEFLELLGRGGMGAVYLAKQAELDRLVAVKVLRPSLARDPAFAQRFAREARALARLAHPNIVALHEAGELDGVYFLVMEHVNGSSLRDLLRGGRLTPAETLALVPQLCAALEHAHAAGVVHRDIKPENVLVTPEGHVKITDFGIARLVGDASDRFTATGEVLGTARYMAPEQSERPDAVDHRVDIYALGVLLYEMLTGELPLGKFAPPSRAVRVDVRLDEIVLRALEKDPARRYQHAAELETDVRRWQSGQGESRLDLELVNDKTAPRAERQAALVRIWWARYENWVRRRGPIMRAVLIVALGLGAVLSVLAGVWLVEVQVADAVDSIRKVGLSTSHDRVTVINHGVWSLIMGWCSYSCARRSWRAFRIARKVQSAGRADLAATRQAAETPPTQRRSR